MIVSASTPSSPSSLRDELAGVKWTGNVRPIDGRTQRRVLDQFHEEQRVRPAKLKPTQADVQNLTGTAIYVLQLFAQGLCTGAVAEACGVHRTQIVRFRNWMSEIHGVDMKAFRMTTDRTHDGLRTCVITGTIRRPAPGPSSRSAAIAVGPVKLPRIGKDEILSLSDRVLRILHRVALRMTDENIADHEGVRPETVGHVLRVLRTKKSELQELRDKSIENIRRLMLVTLGGGR